ncbi:MAG: nitroreductase family protein [Eubacteriaceae bacterium]|nr:nitroreductase family protein [Eubacteriaceae bacterium]
MKKREFKYDIMPEIKSRWSPRAISEKKLSDTDINAILEAASFAPSCFNEQPWRFILAKDTAALEKMRTLLTPSNQLWAGKAPLLIMVLSVKSFEHNGKDNFWNIFDAGTSWGYMSLEAERRGIITHAMGGFNKMKAREAYNISDEYNVISVIAAGYYGNPEELPHDLQEREYPACRKSVEELIIK